MEAKCLDSVGERSVLSDAMNLDRFLARCIFLDKNNVPTCLVCDKQPPSLKCVSMHMTNKQHCRRVDHINSNCENIGKQFTCKLCPGYVAADWKTLVFHFSDNKHFEKLVNSHDSGVSKVSYLALLTNQIIEPAPGRFFCCSCKKLILGWDPVSEHILSDQHTAHIKKVNVTKLENNQCRRLVIHHILIVSTSKFCCYLCNYPLHGSKHCLDHIKTPEHINNMVGQDSISQSVPSILETDQKSQKVTEKVIKCEPSESFLEQMHHNSIVRLPPAGDWFCVLCSCKLPGVPNILQHLSGNRHKNCLRKINNVSAATIETAEISETSSSSWETYEGESQSYDSYDGDSSYSWQSSVNVLDSWETISMEEVISESHSSALFQVPKNLIPLISEHRLQHLKKELFCTLCKAHLRNPQCIINHTDSKYHKALLRKYNANVANQSKKSLATLARNGSVNSQVHLIDEKPSKTTIKNQAGISLQTNIATKPEPSQPTLKLMDIPENLLPLISKHMLQHKAREIYCVACDVHLQSKQSLIAHTKSRYHIADLKYYKAELEKKKKKLKNAPISSTVSHVVGKKNLVHSELSQSKLVSIPGYLLRVLASDYMQHLGHEIFCDPCKVHLQNLETFKVHIHSNKHMTALMKYKAEVLDQHKSSVTSSTASSSPVHVANKRASNTDGKNNAATSTTFTATAKDSQPKLMEIPERLFPLIERHSLKHLAKEIYCPACKVHLKHATSLVSHTKSRAHCTRLKIFRQNSSSKAANAQRSLQSHGSENRMDKTDSNSARIKNLSGALTNLEDTLGKLKITKQNESRRVKYRPSRQNREAAQETKQKKGRSFDPKYLKVDMQHIYKMTQDKLHIMELSCQLCFPKSSSAIYCLICERSETGGLQSFYEHICSAAHMSYLAEVEQNDKLFINYPNQCSDLRLAKEYMQETPNETIQCFACDKSMENDDIVILEHIDENSHMEQKRVWNEEMDKIFQQILVRNTSSWYSIFKYYCKLCDLEYNTEFQFAQHIDDKRHIKRLKKTRGNLVFDSCIPCATVLLGDVEVFTEHCEQPMHRYLVRHGDFAVSKLPEQAITLLQNAEEEVENLIELSDQVLNIQKTNADSLLQCLEHTVRAMYPNAKAYPFGSRVSGLGFPDSDIDVFLDCGTYDGNEKTDNYQRQLILSVEECLNANQKLWEIEETLTTSRTPIIKLRHRDTELRCDVSFKNGLSVENTKLLKCFIDTYPLCRKLMLFVKKWLSSCNLSGSQYITNYAMCWWIIFYLQNKSILPSIASMIAKKNKSKIIAGWETGVSETFDVGGEEYTFTNLLREFFLFYRDFDYRYLVACPLLGSTVQKEDFTELHRLPKEMSPYIDNIKAKTVNGPVELFRIDSEMCIQDPYDLSHNLTKAVRKFTLSRFRQLCAKSADILKDLQQH